jgi:hypothetical protein
VLSTQEQRIWNDVERFYSAEAEEPVRNGPDPARRPRHDARRADDLPAVVVAALWGAIFLIIFGAVAAGFAVGGATGLGWLLWRCWPLLRRQDGRAGADGPGGVPSTRGRGARRGPLPPIDGR